MVKLTRYYTHNTDDKSDASLRDGKFDEKEYAAAAEAIAKINEKLAEKGVVLSTSTMPANTVAKVSENGADIKR
jgi:hypothetical protein